MRPSDIRYRDVNGDDKIDINDAVHIGFPTTPRIIYGFNGNINYKQFEFLFAFQSSGQRFFVINPYAISPFYGGQAILNIADDHWTTDNMNSNTFWTPIYEVRKNVEEQEADCYAYIQSLANPAYDIGMMASDEWGANQYSRDYGQGQSGTSLSWANISDGLQNQ